MEKVHYTLVQKSNPRNLEAPQQYYALTKARKDLWMDEIAQRIERRCTLSKADVYAAIISLEEVIAQALRQGEIVHLGSLGSFQVGIRSEGVEKPEDFDEQKIKSRHITFRTGMGLKRMLKDLEFRLCTEEK